MALGVSRGATYEAFGLRLRSDLFLPELSAAPDDGREPDVEIETGPLGARLGGATDVPPGMQVAGGLFQLDGPNGRYRVTDGRLIRVDPRPGASDEEVRLPLLGTVMGALCHQRRSLPLHAGAILVDDRAVAFAGPSGAGKSSLAARLLRRGRTVLADDLCAVAVDEGAMAWVAAGVPRLRLRDGPPASADRTGFRDAGGRTVVPLAPPPGPGPWRLWRLYRLSPDDVATPRIARLAGSDAAAAVLGQVYRWPIAAAMNQASARFAQVIALTRACEVYDIRFPHDPDRPGALADALERHLLA